MDAKTRPLWDSVDRTGAWPSRARQDMTNHTERIYADLRNAILQNRYPPGSRLRINALCDEHGVSLGAVREALSRLAAEDFVVAEPQKGFSVAPVSLPGLADLTRTRISIETMCLQSAIANADVEWEAGLLAAFHRLARTPMMEAGDSPGGPRLSEGWAAVHAAFHAALVAACDSPWLLKIRQMLYDQSERYRRLSTTASHDSRDTLAEHEALMKAALAHDAAAASQLLHRHLTLTSEIVAALVRPEPPAAP